MQHLITHRQDDGDLEALERDLAEETGWKLVHGDVFRPPAHRMLLSACIGTGMQLNLLGLATILITISGTLFEVRAVFGHFWGSCVGLGSGVWGLGVARWGGGREFNNGLPVVRMCSFKCQRLKPTQTNTNHPPGARHHPDRLHRHLRAHLVRGGLRQRGALRGDGREAVDAGDGADCRWVGVGVGTERYRCCDRGGSGPDMRERGTLIL